MSNIDKLSREELSKRIRGGRKLIKETQEQLRPLEEEYTRRCAEESALKKMGKLRLTKAEQEALERIKQRESAKE